MASRYLKGKFQPRNPEKYRGNANNIVYRSSWELKAFNILDISPSIVEWASEEIVIPYINPLDGSDNKMRRYFIDLYALVKQTDGSVKKFLIEIKPHSQTNKPRKTKSKTANRYAKEMATYITNQAKWDAAKNYCKAIDAKFLIWTENELFGKP